MNTVDPATWTCVIVAGVVAGAAGLAGVMLAYEHVDEALQNWRWDRRERQRKERER